MLFICGMPQARNPVRHIQILFLSASAGGFTFAISSCFAIRAVRPASPGGGSELLGAVGVGSLGLNKEIAVDLRFSVILCLRGKGLLGSHVLGMAVEEQLAGGAVRRVTLRLDADLLMDGAGGAGVAGRIRRRDASHPTLARKP